MFLKKILAQRLFYALLTMSCSTLAMDLTTSKTHADFSGICVAKSVKIVTFLSEHSLKCHLHSDRQSHANLKYENTKFTKVLAAYARRLKERGDAFKVVIMPHDLVFDADTNQLTLFNYLGTQQLFNNTKANLTVKVRGAFSTTDETVINQGAVLYVEYLNSDKKPLVLALAMLNEIYNPKELLKLTPQKQEAVTKHQIFLKALKAARLQNGQSASNCVEPYAYVEKLYTKDVITMLNYYLENYDCLDVA